MGLQQYGSFDLDVIDAEDDEIKKGQRASEFLRMEDGKSYQLRFLPPPMDASWSKKVVNSKTIRSPFKIIHEHFVDVSGQKRKIRFVCPRLTHGGPCPACTQADDLYRTGNQLDKDKAKDMRPSSRVYANVVHRDEDERGPIIYAFGKGVKDALSSIRKKFGDFTDPVGGFDIWIDRKNDGRISYEVNPDRDNTPLHEDENQAEAWLEAQFNLDHYAKVPELEEITAMMSGKQERRSFGNSGGERKQLSEGRGERTRRRTAADDMDDVIEAEVVEEEEGTKGFTPTDCKVPM